MRCTSAITPSHPEHATFLLQAANLRTGVTDHRIVAISGWKGSETFKVDALETLLKRGYPIPASAPTTDAVTGGALGREVYDAAGIGLTIENGCRAFDDLNPFKQPRVHLAK